MKRIGIVGAFSACVALILLVTGCQQHAAEDGAAPVVATASSAYAPVKSSKPSYSLGIVGYNYTEVGIYDYTVNGTGAFNLEVSTESAGGGKTVCCFGWAPSTKLPIPIRVEWTRDGKTWCRKTASFNGPAATEPTNLEVHIFPDRHIEVAITDQYSPPRLKMASAGHDYRVGLDPRAEEAAAIRKDRETAECRLGEFPIGSAQEGGGKR